MYMRPGISFYERPDNFEHRMAIPGESRYLGDFNLFAAKGSEGYVWKQKVKGAKT
jgi:hypothetical protein